MISEFQGKYRWLSNFWPCEVILDGEKYSSVELAYVAAKTLDKNIRSQIQECKTPGQAKRFGRTLKLRNDWDNIKLFIMEDLLRQKFAKRSELGNKLIATGEQQLIEGNNWGDRFWGVCRGRGLNHLGKLLMKIRNEIRY